MCRRVGVTAPNELFQMTNINVFMSKRQSAKQFIVNHQQTWFLDFTLGYRQQ